MNKNYWFYCSQKNLSGITEFLLNQSKQENKSAIKRTEIFAESAFEIEPHRLAKKDITVPKQSTYDAIKQAAITGAVFGAGIYGGIEYLTTKNATLKDFIKGAVIGVVFGGIAGGLTGATIKEISNLIDKLDNQ